MDSGRKTRPFCHDSAEPGFVLACEGSMPPSDEQCVRSCLDDHPEAFRHLVRRYQAPLMRHLCARLGNVDAAAEVAQEAFVRAYFALRNLRKPEAFFSWIFGIADRVAKETHRAAKRCETVSWEQVDLAELAEKPDAPADGAVAEALAKLPETYQEVILLRYYEGHSCAEISRTLDVPLGTVTKRLSRAYALLRESLGARDCPDFRGPSRSDCPDFRGPSRRDCPDFRGPSRSEVRENGTVPFDDAREGSAKPPDSPNEVS